ncbi:MAG TPA: RNA helicase, partial [Gammaproteobacteria bacterium]|nr:RNA helicase [Gammaproteobacteria bacterium]
PHVVNFELPNIAEDYIHRIGRTGRAGSDGEAISLVSPDENSFLRDIEKLLGKKIPRKEIEGFDQGTASDERSCEPRRQGRSTGRGGHQRNGQQRIRQKKTGQQKSGQPRSRNSANSTNKNENRSGNISEDGEQRSTSRSSSPYGQKSNSKRQVNGNIRRGGNSANRRRNGEEVAALFGE